MPYFDDSFLAFFRELSENNHKGWFDENRKRYEKQIKKPFRAFLQAMIERMRIHQPDLMVEPKDVVFRINRDIRFAKDKTPYKTHSAANIAKNGRKDERPGFYLHFSHEAAIIGGGAYAPSTQHLQAIRELISDQLDEFQAIIYEKEFKNFWGNVRGEQNKRIPKVFRPTYEKEPLIANKQFYVFRELNPELILQPDLIQQLMGYFDKLLDFNNFLEQAFDQEP